MFEKNDKNFDKQLDKTLDGILEFYIPAIENHNSFVEESKEKLYHYYLSSHIIRKSEYYLGIENDITIKIIKREGKNIEFIQIGEYKTNIDENILKKIEKLEEDVIREQTNFEILDKKARNFGCLKIFVGMSKIIVGGDTDNGEMFTLKLFFYRCWCPHHSRKVINKF